MYSERPKLSPRRHNSTFRGKAPGSRSQAFMTQFLASGGRVWVSQESIPSFSKQFGPQEFGGGYLVIDFGALGFNFCLWDSNISFWELFLFLLGLVLYLKEKTFVHRSVVIRSLGIAFLAYIKTQQPKFVLKAKIDFKKSQVGSKMPIINAQRLRKLTPIC